jgi:3-oxoacyl-[acyl-carrier-protein] synthase III
MSCFVTGYGTALPTRVVTNSELAGSLGVSAGWIEANSGIRERRWVEPEQSASDLAVAAVSNALNDAQITADQVDYLIAGTLSPDYQIPGIAPVIQHKLDGCRNIPAIDIRAACSSILYCLQLGRGLIESGTATTILCVGAEAQSKGLDLQPRSAELSMLFGDGAGAIVLSSNRGSCDQDYVVKIDDILIETDGSFAEALIVRAPGTANGPRFISESQLASGSCYGSMQGRIVILIAARKLAETAKRILDRNGLTPSQINLVIPHQANANLLTALSRKLGIGSDLFVINIDRLGNTSAASTFLAFANARKERRINSGDRLLLLAFGAGFTWGAALATAVRL